MKAKEDVSPGSSCYALDKNPLCDEHEMNGWIKEIILFWYYRFLGVMTIFIKLQIATVLNDFNYGNK